MAKGPNILLSLRFMSVPCFTMNCDHKNMVLDELPAWELHGRLFNMSQFKDSSLDKWPDVQEMSGDHQSHKDSSSGHHEHFHTTFNTNPSNRNREISLNSLVSNSSELEWPSVEHVALPKPNGPFNSNKLHQIAHTHRYQFPVIIVPWIATWK